MPRLVRQGLSCKFRAVLAAVPIEHPQEPPGSSPFVNIPSDAGVAVVVLERWAPALRLADTERRLQARFQVRPLREDRHVLLAELLLPEVLHENACCHDSSDAQEDAEHDRPRLRRLGLQAQLIQDLLHSGQGTSPVPAGQHLLQNPYYRRQF